MENVIIDTVMKRVGVSIEDPITHSKLEPVIKKAKMTRNHLGGVMAYFLHWITNSIAEYLNSKITTTQKMALKYGN